MRLYKVPEHPLRVYLEQEYEGELIRLIMSLDSKYAAPGDQYSNQEDEEVPSLIFVDEETSQYYIVCGLVNIIMKEANSVGISCHSEIPISDLSVSCPEIAATILEGITLRDYQLEGISASLGYKRGIIQVHTGGGKTEMMIGVARYLLDHTDMNILICVPTTNLLYQTQLRVEKRGISLKDISLLGDGNIIDTSKRLIISTVASAYRRLDNSEEYMLWLSKVDCLMMDEAHHSKCRTWSTLIDRVAPEYLLGFSAEPFHRDRAHMINDLILRGLLGPVIHRVTLEYLVEKGYLAKPYVMALDTRCKGDLYKVVDWRVVNKSCIINNTMRNDMIRDIASMLVTEHKSPLILVQQISHGQSLATSISELGHTVYMMTGGRKITVYVDGRDIDSYVDNDNLVLKDFDEGKIDVLIGTSTLDEGVDIPTLSAVILAGGGKGRLKTVQKIGRSLRPKAGDNVAYVIDFRDRFNVITQSQFKKRKTLYDEMNMPVYYLSSLEEIKQIMDEVCRK